MDSSGSYSNDDFAATAPSPPARKTWRMIRLILYTVGGFVLAMLVLMVVPIESKEPARVAITRAVARSITTAADSFQSEYASLPAPGHVAAIKGDTALATNEPGGIELLNILTGRDQVKNSRNLPLLKIQERRRGKGGMNCSADGTHLLGLYDPWGNPYHIILDTDYDGTVVATLGSTTETIRDQRCVVFSAGKDRTPGTKDDVRSWRE